MIARSSGIAIARSKWHRDRSLRVSSWSLAPFGIAIARSLWHHNRSPWWTSDNYMAQIRTILATWSSSLALERTIILWNSNVSYKKTSGADDRFFAFDAKVKGRMTGGGPGGRPWSATDKYTRLSADGLKSGLWRSKPRQIFSLGPLVLSSSEDHYCTMVSQKNRSVSLSHFL